MTSSKCREHWKSAHGPIRRPGSSACCALSARASRGWEAPMLSVEQLEVRFPGLPVAALDIAALAFAPGEHVAVTGPSGCGKTTLVNVLTGMERPTGGHVMWGDADLTAMTETQRDNWRARHVGLVMQEFHLFAGLSALDNVLLPQRLARLRLPAGMKDEAEALLARVGIIRLNQPSDTMSRGQMKRERGRAHV